MATANNDGFIADEQPSWYEPSSQSGAAIQGFGQGGSLGLGPYLGAAGSYLAQSLTPGMKANWSGTLAELKQTQAQTQKQNPGSYSVGELLGGAVPAIATGGESLLGTVVKNAGAGAIQGAATAESGQTGKDALTGAALSGAGAGVLGAVGKVGSLIKNAVGRNTLAKSLEAATETKNGVFTPAAIKIQNNVTKDAIESGKFDSPEAAAAQTQKWFGTGTDAQPISLNGKTIQPGEVGYDDIAQHIPGIQGTPEGYAYKMIEDLRDPKVTTSQLAQNTKDETTSPYGLIHRTLTQSSTPVGQSMVQGAVQGGGKMISNPLAVPMDLASAYMGYQAGGVPGAIAGYVAPIAAGAVGKGAANVGSTLASHSYANILAANKGSLGPTATGVMGAIGGYTGRAVEEGLNQANNITGSQSPQPEDGFIPD